MATASTAFHVFDPTTGTTVAFNVDDEVPDHLAVRVGDHVLAGEIPVAPPEGPQALDVKAVIDAFAEVHGFDDGDALVAYLEDEGATREPFDPSAHSADEVKKYLSALDPADDDQRAEYERVVELETGDTGKKRVSAIPS